ncbi:MAG: DUF2148 domain-containing protein [Treponemataceae bacterium]|nr:DUF2148 domain-containing protein [Treponemataceae bacterium]
MVYTSATLEHEGIQAVLHQMAIAARTAPKARGVDEILTLALTEEDKDRLADEMQRIGEEKNLAFFVRDAKNVRTAQAVFLIGFRNKTRGVPNCGNCGYRDCAENLQHQGVCALGVVDLGIAVGSAVSVANASHVDNRIMFTIGKAALALGLLPEAHTVYGIPLSASGKSPFFDRG